MNNPKFLFVPILVLSGFFLISNFAWTSTNEEFTQSKDTYCFSPLLESKEDSNRYNHIDNILSEAFKNRQFNGNVLYAENGKIIYNKTFGYENIKTKKELTNESVFQLASTSKPFTAIAILKLQEEGKINIDMPVIFYLPDFPFKTITVKHLLQHRSGLPDYIYLANKHWPKTRILKNSDLNTLIRKHHHKLVFPADSRFKYCNTNYAYLANVIEKITKKTFAESLDELIFTPLKMEKTFVYDAFTKNDKNAVSGYCFSKKRGFYERPNDFLDGVVGDKGIYSSVEDLFLFDQALYNNHFINEKSIEMAFTPARPFNDKHKNDYGLGFRIKEENGQDVVYHNGWWKGFRTYYIHDYQNKRTLIWLNNRSDVTVSPHMQAILNHPINNNESSIPQGDYGSAE